MPDFMRQLRGRAAIAARALELTVLCATRTNETLKMKWSEVNLQTEVWTVPKERMKMNVEHRIPLPPRAVEIIKEMVRGRSEEHTSELQSLMRSSYAVFCLKTKKSKNNKHNILCTDKTKLSI